MVNTFRKPIDICNRALQHVGSRRITDAEFANPTTNKSASEVVFCYDKLRQAELRRNVWVFSTRRTMLRAFDATTLLLNPPAYVATAVYQPGHIVTDAEDMLWTSATPFNVGNTPGDTADWMPYFGPLTADTYSSTTGYFPGEIVYVQGTVASLASIYIAQIQTQDIAPGALEAWDATKTYKRADMVSYLGTTYLSLLDLNLNYAPASALTPWAAATTYAMGAQVITYDGRIYTSNANGNLGNVPSLASTAWTVATSAPFVQAWLAFTGGVASNLWRYYGDGTSLELKSPYINWPLGTGPAAQSGTRNVYRLPAGYLRKAPQQPKAGSVSYLGAPSGLGYTDWEYNGNYLISREVYPIPFRFGADITDVTTMDPMFCEGLACRIAAEICETLTQSVTKISTIAAAYKAFMGEARTVNAIESGADEPPLDDYIQCRF